MQAGEPLCLRSQPTGYSQQQPSGSFLSAIAGSDRNGSGRESRLRSHAAPPRFRLERDFANSTDIDGVPVLQSSGSTVQMSVQSVGPDFFHTLGIPVLQGRDITDADASDSPKTVVVNEYFARKYLKDGALGHRLDSLPGEEIVGVVRNSKNANVDEDPLPALYYPLTQTGMMGQITVEVRAAGDPMALLPDMQRAIHELDPNLPLQKPMMQAAQFAETYITPQLFARLSFAFGLLAVGLVASGLYGTLAYRVERRKNEIGIRMALGARRADVLWMILRESLLMISAGFALGWPMSFLVSRLLRSQTLSSELSGCGQLRRSDYGHSLCRPGRRISAGAPRGLGRAHASFKDGVRKERSEEITMSNLLRNLGYSLRRLRKNPGLTIVVLLTLALGIGANTAMFTVDYSSMIAHIPYPNPDQLVVVWSTIRDGKGGTSAGDLLDWRRENSTFQKLDAVTSTSVNLSTQDQPDVRQRVANHPGFVSHSRRQIHDRPRLY